MGVWTDMQRVAARLSAAGLVPKRLDPFVRALSGADSGREGAAGYEAAKRSRMRADWTLRDVGPNTLGQGAIGPLRARVRDLVRNDPHCARAVEVIAGAIVGTGIVPRAKAVSDADQAAANAAWENFCRAGVADIEGQHTLEFLALLATRALVADGEVFVRRHWAQDAELGFFVELLESDMLDDSKTLERTEAGGRIWQGIELDARGRRVAYWFRRNHPGESGLKVSLESVRVLAVDVIHLFMPLRPRQLRGVPFLAPVLTTKRDLKDYENFELVRKKTEALVVAIATPPPIETAFPDLAVDPSTGKQIPLVPSVLNAEGELVGDLAPGAVLTVENGGAVNFHTPQISSNYDTYKRAILTSIAVGLQMTYEDLSGDLGNVNYTSYKAGRIQFDGYVDRVQWLVVIPQLMQRLWDWCQLGAYMVGDSSMAAVMAEWAVPARPSPEPEREAVADIVEARGGLGLLTDKIAKRGWNPREFFLLLKEEREMFAKLGLTLDADPALMSFRGATANSNPPKPTPEEKP